MDSEQRMSCIITGMISLVIITLILSIRSCGIAQENISSEAIKAGLVQKETRSGIIWVKTSREDLSHE